MATQEIRSNWPSQVKSHPRTLLKKPQTTQRNDEIKDGPIRKEAELGAVITNNNDIAENNAWESRHQHLRRKSSNTRPKKCKQETERWKGSRHKTHRGLTTRLDKGPIAGDDTTNRPGLRVTGIKLRGSPTQRLN